MKKGLLVVMMLVVSFLSGCFGETSHNQPSKKAICSALEPFVKECERACKTPYTKKVTDNYNRLQSKIPPIVDEYLRKTGDEEFAAIIRGLVWHASSSGICAGEPAQREFLTYYKSRLQDLARWCAK